MEIHEVANIFPMMNEEQYAVLLNSIKKKGQKIPIWVYQGKIIDGRNRYKACQELGIKPKIQEWDGDGSLVEFIMALNLERRDLSLIEKIEVAKKAKPLLAEEAAKRQKATQTLPRDKDGKFSKPVGDSSPSPDKQGENTQDGNTETGKSDDKAGKLVGISGRTLSRYERVERDGIHEVISAMKNEEIPIFRANEIAKLPEDQQLAALDEYVVTQKEKKNLKQTPAQPGKGKDPEPPKSQKELNEEYLAANPDVIENDHREEKCKLISGKYNLRKISSTTI